MAEETGTNQQGATTQPTGGQQAAAPKAEAATFTQEQLEKILDERLKRERARYADYDELKKYREEQDAARKSETEKLAERATKAEAEAKKVRDETTTRLLNAEARAQAAELGFAKPDKSVRLADLADAVKDGEVDAAKVKAALEALAKEMPELLKPTKTPVPQPGATNPSKDSGTKETDEQRRARLRGGNAFNDWLSSGGLVIHE